MKQIKKKSKSEKSLFDFLSGNTTQLFRHVFGNSFGNHFIVTKNNPFKQLVRDHTGKPTGEYIIFSKNCMSGQVFNLPVLSINNHPFVNKYEANYE